MGQIVPVGVLDAQDICVDAGYFGDGGNFLSASPFSVEKGLQFGNRDLDLDWTSPPIRFRSYFENEGFHDFSVGVRSSIGHGFMIAAQFAVTGQLAKQIVVGFCTTRTEIAVSQFDIEQNDEVVDT